MDNTDSASVETLSSASDMNLIRVFPFGEQRLPDLDVTGWQRMRSVQAMTIASSLHTHQLGIG